jgi:hypothetical protein
VDTSVTVDPTPTGAVENTGEPITTKFGPSGLRSTNTVEIPESQSFRAPGVKIVNGPEQEKPKGQTTAESPVGSARVGRRQQRGPLTHVGASGVRLRSVSRLGR